MITWLLLGLLIAAVSFVSAAVGVVLLMTSTGVYEAQRDGSARCDGEGMR